MIFPKRITRTIAKEIFVIIWLALFVLTCLIMFIGVGREALRQGLSISGVLRLIPYAIPNALPAKQWKRAMDQKVIYFDEQTYAASFYLPQRKVVHFDSDQRDEFARYLAEPNNKPSASAAWKTKNALH